MKKIIAIIVLTFGCVSIYAQNEATKEALKAANDMVYDLAHGKIERFNWLTVGEVDQLFHPKNARSNDKWREILENPGKVCLPELQDIKKNGTSMGVDWNNVVVTDIRYTGKYDEDFGAEEMRGFIFVKSHGKTFRIFFKRGFLLNEKWRLMELRSIEKTSKIPPQLPKSGKN